MTFPHEGLPFSFRLPLASFAWLVAAAVAGCSVAPSERSGDDIAQASAASTVAPAITPTFYSGYFASGQAGAGVDTVGIQVFADGEVRTFFCGGASTVANHTKWLDGMLVGSLQSGSVALHDSSSPDVVVTTIHFEGDTADGTVFRKEDRNNPAPATWTAKSVANAPWGGLYENGGFSASDHKGLVLGVLEGAGPARYWWQGAAIHSDFVEIVEPIGGHSTPAGNTVTTTLPSNPNVIVTLQPIKQLASAP